MYMKNIIIIGKILKIIRSKYTEEGCEAQKYIKNNFFQNNNLHILF
jgi:hypothetical protein